MTDWRMIMTSIHVLTAIEDGKVKECIVIPHDEVNVEFGIRSALYEIYGAANVCSGSREIGHIPANIARFLAKKSICVRKEDKWIPYEGAFRPTTGSRMLVKYANGMVNIANFTYNHESISYQWLDDNGNKVGCVKFYKVLE
jgi:hypothetical protein